MGTIGGSIAHADPASDLPTVMVALGAEFVVRGAGGASRTVAAGDFFKGLFTPDLAANEVLTEVRVPVTNDAGWSYIKFHRRAQDWALVGVAAVRSNGAAHVALTNMGETPLRAAGVEEALGGGSDPATAAGRADEGHQPAVGLVRQRRVPPRAGEGPRTSRARGDLGLAAPPVAGTMRAADGPPSRIRNVGTTRP